MNNTVNLKSLEQIMFTLLTKTKLSKYVTPKDIKILKKRIAGEGTTFLTQRLSHLDKGLLFMLSHNDFAKNARSELLKYLDISNIEGPENIVFSLFTARRDDVPVHTEALAGPYEFDSDGYWQELMNGETARNAAEGQGCNVYEAFSFLDMDLFPGFKLKAGCVYPCLFSKAFEAIFEKDGLLRSLDQIDTDAVQLIRQVSHLFYKLDLPFTDSQLCETSTAFKKADEEIGDCMYNYEAPCPVLIRAKLIVQRLLAGVNPLEIHPKHGSGASACGVIPHERYSSFRFIPRLNEVFPYDEYFFFSKTHLVDELDKLLECEEADPPAKVVCVPKDSRGPRLISEEPREFMYIQQGLMKLLYDTVDKRPGVARQIGFNDQSRNQDMAKLGSLTGEYATLDLKEASDRVSWDLVKYLFPDIWVCALGASRSLSTVLPNGDVVTFNKFAPMGSALCFPVETICFWAISLAAMHCQTLPNKYGVSRNNAGRKLRLSVFGDDIIVPTAFADSVQSALESVGLIVNTNKSFRSGPFRESCGGDYFNGVSVVPIRCKAIPHGDRRAAFRTCELFNNLIRTYGYGTIGWLLGDLFQQFFGYEIPVSSRYRDTDLAKTQQGLYLIGPYTDVPPTYKRRWNSNLQVTEFRIPCMKAKSEKIELLGWSPLLRKTCLKLSQVGADTIALAKRYTFKYSWTQL